MKEVYLRDTRSQKSKIYHPEGMEMKDLHLEDTRSLNIPSLGS
jgi:hypothetical protein